MAKKEYDATDIQPVVPYGHDGTEHRRLKVDSSGKISVGESALPSGAATAAKQDDGITQLTAISGKLNIVPADYDLKEYSYTGTNLTSIVYKLGAVTVMTKTLAYDGTGNLTSITIT